MKILLLSHEFPPVGGGAGNGVYHLAKELLKNNCEIHLITSKYSDFNTKHLEGLKISHLPGYRKSIFENRVIPTFTSFIFHGRRKIKKLIKNEQIDIIHSFFTLPAGYLSYNSNKKFGIPSVLSLRGSDVPFHSKSLLPILLKPFFRKIWKNTDRVIALSKGLTITASRTYSKAKDFQVIHNGVDDEFWHPDQRTLDLSTYRLVTVCRLIPLKGIQDVLQSLYLLKNEGWTTFHYTIVGDGEYLKELKKLVLKLELSNFVSFTGYLQKEEIRKIFWESDAFILTSYAEAFGQVFTEAISCGLPLIGSRVGGIPEIINDQCGLLVEKGNAIEISLAIKSLSQTKFNKELLRAYAKTFSWKTSAANYLLEYEQLLNKRYE